MVHSIPVSVVAPPAGVLSDYRPHPGTYDELFGAGAVSLPEFRAAVEMLGACSPQDFARAQSLAELPLGEHSVVVEYRPAQRELPFTVKLLDFRKIDYPGTEMASGFESDVELTDAQRGIILLRKISMNHPLRYRGFSLYQSSYVPGAVETTVLSVRSDPGTPFVYAGFLIVIGGVVAMFLDRSRRPLKQKRR